MATALTPRQEEIKKLLDSGKTPTEAAKKLKITENAVYQHMRRIRGATNGSKPQAAAKRSTAKRSRSRTRSRTRPAATPPKPEPVVRDMTPLQAIRARRSEIEAQIKESTARVEDAIKTLEREKEAHAKLVANRDDELKRLIGAEAQLTGTTKRPARHTRKAPAAPPAAAAPPAESPAPAASDGGEATPASEAPHTTPREGLEVVGPPEEERPGVQTVPEFAQEPEGAFAE